jgi:aurora kinase A
VIVGSAPFLHDDYEVTYRKIMKLEYKIPPHVSKAAAHLISNLLVVNPDKRMPLDKVAMHPWLSVNAK